MSSVKPLLFEQPLQTLLALAGGPRTMWELRSGGGFRILLDVPIRHRTHWRALNTVELAPRLVVPVSGMPFGNTSVLQIDGRGNRLIRKVWVRTGIFVALCVAGVGFFIYVGQPLWGNWPQVNATVTSQEQYQARSTHCSLGLSYMVDGRALRTYYSEFDPCSQSRAIGSVVRLGVDPANHSRVDLAGVPDPFIMKLVVAGGGAFIPLSWMGTFVYFTWRNYRLVKRLGGGPWHEVSGTVVAASIANNRLIAVIRAVNGPDFRIVFGLRGITFFPTPVPGSALVLRLAGDGSGGVMVGVKGLDGDNLGAVRAIKLRAAGASGPGNSMQP